MWQKKRYLPAISAQKKATLRPRIIPILCAGERFPGFMVDRVVNRMKEVEDHEVPRQDEW